MKEESLFDLNKSKEVTVEKKKSRFFYQKEMLKGAPKVCN